MHVTTEELGRRLRLARDSLRMTQNVASAAARLQRSAISLMESGQRQVSTLELTRLAHLYGRPVEWFVNPRTPVEEDPVVALFRAEPSLKNADVRHQAEHCIRMFLEGASLVRLLRRETASMLPHYELPDPHSTGIAIAQGRSVADQERRRLGLGVAPLFLISELIGSQGIWAAAFPMPDGISGLYLRSMEFGMGILVNVDQASVRRRFSYAHEYGHALMDRNHGSSATSLHNAKDVREQRANAFAAAFLIPEDGVWDFMYELRKGRGSRREETAIDNVTEEAIRGELRRPPHSQHVTYADAALLSRNFGVSYSAAVWRLRGLNIISTNEANGLLKRTATAKRYLKTVRHILGDSEDESTKASDDRNELKWQILPLALEAWRRRVISRNRLLKIGRLLRIDDDITLDLANAVGP